MEARRTPPFAGVSASVHGPKPFTFQSTLGWQGVPGRMYDVQYLPEGASGFMPLPGAQGIDASAGDHTSHVVSDIFNKAGSAALFRVSLRTDF